MDNSPDLSLQGRRHRDDQTPVAHSRCHVFVYHSLALCITQDAIQRPRNAPHRRSQFASNTGQLRRSIILDLTIGGKNIINTCNDLRKDLHITGQPAQTRIGYVLSFRFLPASISSLQETYNITYRLQRPLQIEQFLFVQIHAFHPYAAESRTYIKKILSRKVIFFLQDTYQFTGLFQSFVHLVILVGEGHFSDPFFT